MRLARQFTVRHMMAVVAVSALASLLGAGVRLLVSAFAHDPYGLGLSSGLLSPGQAVRLTEDFRAAPAIQAIRPTGRTDDKSVMYERVFPAPTGGQRLTSGTPAVVTIDPAWDEDSCDPNRPIAIRPTAGEYLGLELAVPRRLLRKR